MSIFMLSLISVVFVLCGVMIGPVLATWLRV